MDLSFCITYVLIACQISYAAERDPEFELDNGIEDNLVNSKPTVVSVDELREGRHVLGATQQFMSEYPPWANMTLLLIGQKLLRRRYASYLYGVGLSTFLVGASTDARRVVISGGRATRPEPSFHRYLITILHYSFWANVDLQRKASDLFDVMNTLHAVHAKIGHAAMRKRKIFDRPLIPSEAEEPNPYKLDTRAWSAFEADLRASPLNDVYENAPVYPPKDGGTEVYFNQFAMAIQQWAFIGLPVLHPARVFMYNVSEEELWGFVHFFALILRTLGAQDEYNICLQPNLGAARVYYQEMLEKYFIPTLFNLDYESKVVMELGIKGIEQIFPYTDLQLMLFRVCEDVLHIECPSLRRVLKPQARVYNTILERLGRTLMPFDFYSQIPTFFINSMLRELSRKSYNVDTLTPQNLTDGLIAIDENLLATSDVYFKEEMRESCCSVI